MPKQKFAALDTGFLLALAAGDGHCEAVVDWLGGANLYALVTPTVLQEIDDIERCEPQPDIQDLARRVRERLATWGFLKLPMSPVQHGIARAIALKLIEKRILPDEAHAENDGLVIAESALQECAVLVTERQTLTAIGVDILRLALLESDVPDIFTITPSEIVAYIERNDPPQ